MNFSAKIKDKLLKAIDFKNSIYSMGERLLILSALDHSKRNMDIVNLYNLSMVEFRAFSQWGEDGIICWLTDNLPGIQKSFIEFGVENYRESNTRLLLQLKNWYGLVIDGSSKNIKDIRSQEIYWRFSLEAKAAFIDCENINELIGDSGFVGEIGLLSIDIDGNDYWVWKAIEIVHPAIVVCEYNAVFGDIYSLTVPYSANFERTKAHHSNLYFGSSIRALIQLGNEKGYQFVGTTSTGCNAFFVRKDLAPSILGKLEVITAYPSSVREARDPLGKLLFIDGPNRPHQIGHLPLIDTESGAKVRLNDYDCLYSNEWSKRVGSVILHNQ